MTIWHSVLSLGVSRNGSSTETYLKGEDTFCQNQPTQTFLIPQVISKVLMIQRCKSSQTGLPSSVVCVCVCVCVCARACLVIQFCPILCNLMDPGRFLCAWDSPGKNTGVGCHSLVQGLFLTQGLNPCLLRCRQILYHLSDQGSPEYFVSTGKYNMENSLQIKLSQRLGYLYTGLRT